MTITINRDPEELAVAATGYVAVSGLDAALPTAIEDLVPDGDGNIDLDTGWVDLGYITEAGPRFSFDRTTKDIGAWQEFDPVRTLITAIPKQVEFDLRQWSSESMRLGIGGAVVTAAGGGVMLEPEDTSFLDERQLIIYGADGDKHYGFVFRRAQNTKTLQFPFVRDDESALPIGMKILGPPAGETKPWFLLTDDPAFEADGS